MDELEPCPMCRSKNINAYSMIVQCARCGLSTSAHKAHSYAVAAWNRRPAEEALVKALRELLRVDDDWHGSVSSEMSAARAAARALLEGK